MSLKDAPYEDRIRAYRDQIVSRLTEIGHDEDPGEGISAGFSRDLVVERDTLRRNLAALDSLFPDWFPQSPSNYRSE